MPHTPEVLIAAINSRRKEDVRKILSEGVTDINGFSLPGHGPLLIAAQSGDLECVQMLLDAGADINAQANSNSFTALLTAAVYNQAAAARLLIQRGAKLEIRNSLGWTALFGAAQNGYSDVVRSLIEAGADINARNNVGQTPLITAVMYSRNPVVELLLLAGADKHARDNNDMTVFDHAQARGGDVFALIDNAEALINRAREAEAKAARTAAEKAREAVQHAETLRIQRLLKDRAQVKKPKFGTGPK